MRFSTEQLEDLLRANVSLLEDDPEAVALEFDIGDDGEIHGLVLVHRNPVARKLSPDALAVAPPGFPSLPLRVERGELPSDEISTVDVEPLYDETHTEETAGLGGTKVCEGGGCGTLTLSGTRISVVHDGRRCEVDGPFLLSNSHVFHRAGGIVTSAGAPVGVVASVFDLEAKTAFDAGVAESNSRVPLTNAFKVFNPQGAPISIDRLENARPGMSVAKMGMVSGWTVGKVGAPTITRVRGHRALYPGWTGTYRSRAGDSGSPILWKDEKGLWCLVGLHFSSGPRFQSWNNAEVTASRS